MKLSDYLLETLERNGVTRIFGNPGTTEIPLVRACEKRKQLRYIVALSEVAAVPMADGYARATRSLGVIRAGIISAREGRRVQLAEVLADPNA